MAQHDYNLANADGATFRTDLNNALQAILTNNSGATVPTTTAAFMFWVDTSNATTYYIKQRNHDNTAWVIISEYDTVSKTFSNYTILAATIHAATSKATPVDADELPIVDSAASNVLKKLTWANLKTTLASTFLSLSGGSLTGQLISTLAIGTKPFAVTSTTKCDNLNADLLDGYDTSTTGAASKIPVVNASGTLPLTSGVTLGNTAIADASTLDFYLEGTWTPVVTAYSGTITTASAANSTFTRNGNRVTIDTDITVTTNGTGATLIKVSGLPYNSSLSCTGNGVGVNSSTNKMCWVQTSGNNNYVYLGNYDGTYPIASGQTIRFSLTYQV